MTQECPDCGSHFTTYEQPGGTVAGYTTDGRYVRSSTTTNNQELHGEFDDMAANGWEIRQIVYNPHRLEHIVVFERPHGWGGDYA